MEMERVRRVARAETLPVMVVKSKPSGVRFVSGAAYRLEETLITLGI
jgi:hypothetical protein